MKDPVALAYSGRIAEARAAAVAQAMSPDGFVASQALEALAVLGEQHGFRADAELDGILLEAVKEPSLSRRAFEAAIGLDSKALELVAIDRLRNGPVSWGILRYAGASGRGVRESAGRAGEPGGRGATFQSSEAS